MFVEFKQTWAIKDLTECLILNPFNEYFGARSLRRRGIWSTCQLFISSVCCLVKFSFWGILILPNGHLAKWPFCQMVILSNGHLGEWSFCQMVILPNGHLAKWPFSQMVI